MAKKKLRKGRYKVVNWKEYNNSLKNRGDLTIWFTEDGINSWFEKSMGHSNRGRQKQYSNSTIKMIYTIIQVFHLRLRQSEGFVTSILKLLGAKLQTPDYTTISRRIRNVSVDIITHKPQGKINLILDSSGIKVIGEKEWISHKYHLRQRKIWRKLHIGVTDDGTIVAAKITTLRDSDIATVPALLEQTTNKVDQIVADGAYHKKRMLNYMSENDNTKESKFIGPPRDKAKTYGNRIKVEETFSRYKRIIGNKFKALNFRAQQNEAKISLFILNKMKDIGMPVTVRVA